MKNKEQIFMNIAIEMSLAATCNRAHNGAVIISPNNRILSAGYNGSPSGEPHCEDVGCEIIRDPDGTPHCIRTTHAEMNAIINAARAGVSLKGSMMFSTMEPCYDCAKAIVNAGIKSVVYLNDYSVHMGCSLLNRRGVELRKYG